MKSNLTNEATFSDHWCRPYFQKVFTSVELYEIKANQLQRHLKIKLSVWQTFALSKVHFNNNKHHLLSKQSKNVPLKPFEVNEALKLCLFVITDGAYNSARLWCIISTFGRIPFSVLSLLLSLWDPSVFGHKIVSVAGIRTHRYLHKSDIEACYCSVTPTLTIKNDLT